MKADFAPDLVIFHGPFSRVSEELRLVLKKVRCKMYLTATYKIRVIFHRFVHQIHPKITEN